MVIITRRDINGLQRYYIRTSDGKLRRIPKPKPPSKFG
uniref:Uncharacterized protein n=1 Tax=viral metagenome TaxID=1070528 RepID=A0A6C0KA80_9ZZZZ